MSRPLRSPGSEQIACNSGFLDMLVLIGAREMQIV